MDYAKMLEEAEREYHPCQNGIHVCGVTADEERPLTVANVPGVTEAKWDVLKSAFQMTEDDTPDLVIDFMVNGDIMEDFGIRRQQLDALLQSCK